MMPGNASRTELWQRYFEESQEQLQELDRLLNDLREMPDSRELLESVQRIFHNFAGSGALYSAPKISAIGGEGEYTCYSASISERPLSTDELGQFERLVRNLRGEFQSLISRGEEAGQNLRPTRRGIPILYLVSKSPELDRDLSEYLSKRGVQVENLGSIEEARKRLDTAMPDLVAVNTSLADGTGYEFVQEIRAREASPFIPILLVGESNSFLDKVEAIHCGADGFVTSPPDPATIFRKFKSLLARRKAGSARILAVEDDPAQGRFLEECLASEGYLVRVIDDPLQFEAEIHAFRPNLVLMDVLLPTMSGYDLVKFLRQEEGFAAVPVIFLTTEGQRRSMVKGVEVGGDDYLVKPISSTDLVTTVRSRLARYRSLQDLMDHDELTSLLAHVPFLQQARLCLSRFTRRDIAYAMVFLQIDQMEDHVKRHGPKIRGILVQRLAKFLKRKVRQTDIMGLYADNLIAVVLEHLTEKDAARLIRRLQLEFAALDHPIGKSKSVRATFCAGISMTAQQFKTLKDWIDAATGALDLAKQFGHGRTVLAGQQIPEE